ncbi:hypothetical protein OIU74_009888 [Salix koriyanagi]|uniref:Uncharacterized protein n=1 Tax=Salix koriyanagi TaxID=2511006 RepID=A0A9Q0TCF3_9ROSI|nr:hypothetical protein OIU74_009888 [Salix koriyanagi]
MGNFSALTLISDECFHNKSNLDLPAVDSVAAKLLPPRSYSTRQAIINELELRLKKVMSRETEEAQDSNGTSTMSIVLYVVRSFAFSRCQRPALCGGISPLEKTIARYCSHTRQLLKLTNKAEAQVEEGNASALLPTKPCKTEKNCEFPHARLEEWISTLLLPHQLFEEASSCESVEDHKQTEAQVEESRNAQSLPHPEFKRANNCESVEAHKQTEKKVEECTTTLHHSTAPASTTQAKKMTMN